ncbi:hypothetical protein [Enterocloster citroniae]
MVADTWYQYKGDWYYLDQNGKLSMDPVVLTPDQDGCCSGRG